MGRFLTIMRGLSQVSFFALLDVDYEFIWANYGGNGCLKGAILIKYIFSKGYIIDSGKRCIHVYKVRLIEQE